MPPKPATQVAELVTELNRLREMPIVDQFRLQRVQASARKCMATDFAGAHMVLGMAASISLDYEEMRSHFEIAVTSSPNDTAIWANYTKSLSGAGFVSEAVDIADRALNDNPHDLLAIEYAAWACLMSGRIREALAFLARWSSLNSGKENRYLELVREIDGFLESNNIPQKVVESIVKLVTTSSGSTLSRELNYSILTDEESSWLVITCEIPFSVEEVVDANFVLASALREADIAPEVSTLVTALYQPLAVESV